MPEGEGPTGRGRKNSREAMLEKPSEKESELRSLNEMG